MSKTIDERVVSMQFDNKQFEKNVSTTMSTLDKLKQSLNLTGAAKGLENVNSAAKGFDISPLSKGVESVKLKFSALEVMAVTALSNITNSAVNAGKRLVSAFTTDPIKTGFQEYETQINAVQTILANTESKGSTLQDVNRALAELNTYADKTIYNFTEMTRNIGTFTAAGVDLKTSVSAIKGIANLAAISGSSSQQASTAMYQLSQALASGTVKLMDWNSVVNAGMGGQVFQDALKETARVHGIAIDNMIKKQGSFRETLQSGWLTTEILTETLNHFTMAAEEGSEEWEAYKKSLMDTGYSEKQAVAILKMANTATDAATKVKTFTQLMDTLKESAQSGWTKSWEIMIGDFEEAKNFLTDVSDRLGEMIGQSADARNKMLSGGLSSGWKQLLDAGIADEEGYKETFKSVAKEHGTSIDEMIEAEKKLDSSLTDSEAFQKALKKGFKEGKLSSDMLSESVYKLADKMSNMSAKELEAAGYTADHVKQIKDLSAGLKDGSISMDEFVKKITRTSGRENIIQALWNAFDGLMTVITPVKEAFRDIFPAITGDQLYKFTERIRDFTAKLKLSGIQSDQLKSTFKGLFAVVDIGWTFVKKLASGITKLVGSFKGVGGSILNTTASIGDWLVNLRDSIKETDIFGKVIDGVVNFIIKAISKIKEFGSAISDWVGNLRKTIQESDLWGQRIAKITEFFSKAKDGIKDFFSKFGEKIAAPGLDTFLVILGGIWELIKKIGSVIGKFAKKIGTAFTEVFRSGDLKGGLDLLNGGIFTAILLGIKKFVGGIKDTFDGAGGILDGIKGVLDGVKGCFEAWQQDIKANVLMKIAKAIALLTAAILVLSLIDPEKLNSSLGAITLLFAELIGSMAIFNKIGGKGVKGVLSAANTLIIISSAVLILSFALKNISNLSWEQLAKGLVGVTVLLGEVVAAAILLSKYGGKIKRVGIQMVIIAAALKILASVCKDLSELSWEQLAKGVSGIGAILLEFIGFQALMKLIKPKKMLSSATALVIIGAAMEIFANVCSKFGQMDWGSLGKAGAAIGGILLLASGFALLSGLSKKMLKSSIALVIIGASMEIFADVCNKFGTVNWESLGKAGAAIGGILLLASGFALLSGLSQKMIRSSIALAIIGAAMEIFADVCSKFSQMDWESLGKAGAAIGGILALSAGFALLAGLSNGILKSAAALVVMALALTILTPVLKTLGGMSWEEIAKGLVTIAGVFAIVGVAGLLLGPIVPVILSLAGAIALLGLACFAVGAGILAFSIGFTALSTATAAGATAIVAALGIIIVGILDLIPTIIDELTKVVVSLCQVIIQSAPAIGEAIKALVLAVMEVLVECVPQIAAGALEVISGVLDALIEYGPQIVGKLYDFLIGVINAIADKLPGLIQAGVNLIMAFFKGIVDALKRIDTEVLLQGIVGVGLLSALMLALSAVAALIPGAMIGVLGMGAVIAELALVLAAVGGLAQIPGLEWLISEGGDFLQKIGTAIGQFIGGIVGGIAEGITASLPQIATDLSNFMTNLSPFISGAKLIDDGMLNGVKSLVEVILMLTGASLLEKITSWITGGSSFTDFTAQLLPFGDAMVEFSSKVSGNIDEEAVLAAANAGKIMAEMAKTLPNSGGVVGFFAGENDMIDFAAQLVPFGQAMADFSGIVAGNINEEAVTAAANAGKTMAEMAKTLPNSGGVVGFFAGNNDIDDFGVKLVSFGESIVDFSNKVSGNIDGAAVTAAANAGRIMSEFAQTLPEDPSIWECIMGGGQQSLGDFAKQLPPFGEGIKEFSDSVGDNINVSAVRAAATAGKTMAEMVSELDGTENVSILSELSSELPTFGQAMVDFSSKVNGMSTSSLSSNVSNFKEVVKTLTDISKSGLNEFVKNFKVGETKAISSINKMLSSMITIIKAKGLIFASLGKGLMVNFARGIHSNKTSLSNAFSKNLESTITTIKNYYNKFYSAGAYVVMGFVNGIDANTYKAEGKAAAMALKAEAAAKAALNAHSPSKKFYKVGTYAGMGFVNALDDYGSESYKAGFAMADNARDGLSKAISTVRDLINNGMDDQLTIRPVLDLSNVTSGANQLNGLFNTNPSVGLLSNVRSVSSMMNRNQNGVSDDVISAIKDLGNKINASSGDTYSINGITYDDGSNVSEAVKTLTRAVKMGRRT